jgi:hypothetical protein
MLQTATLKIGPKTGKHRGQLEEKLKWVVDDVADRVFQQNFAAMIIIDGGVGQGKTTIAVEIADHINNGPIDFEEQLSMGGMDFQQKLEKCFLNKRKVLIYDEAGDFNRRSALTKFNSDINRIFETFRAFKIVIILILPFFNNLDEQIFYKEIPRILIHVHSRNPRYGKYSVYSLRRIFYLKNAMKKEIVKPSVYFKQPPNLGGVFYDLETKRSKQLTDFSIKGKFKILGEAKLRSQKLKNFEDLEKEWGVPIDRLRRIANVLRLKPDDRFRGKNYYNPETIENFKSKLMLRNKRAV